MQAEDREERRKRLYDFVSWHSDQASQTTSIYYRLITITSFFFEERTVYDTPVAVSFPSVSLIYLFYLFTYNILKAVRYYRGEWLKVQKQKVQ